MALQTHKAKPGHHRPEKDTSGNSFFGVHTFCSKVLSLFSSMPFVRNVSHKYSLYRLPQVHLSFSDNLGVASYSASWRQRLLSCVTVARTVLHVAVAKNFSRLRFVIVYAGMLTPASYSWNFSLHNYLIHQASLHQHFSELYLEKNARLKNLLGSDTFNVVCIYRSFRCTRAVRKVKNFCPYNPRSCFIVPDQSFGVFSRV
jgi:hypothetical protein